jgi:excisionase family DNA binding protein
MPAADFLTVPEAARRLQLSVSGTYALIRSGILPAARIGRTLRISERVLVNFIEAGGRAWPGGWRKTAS